MRAIIAAMEGMLQPPSATAFDAIASVVSLIVYLGAALGVLARQNDSRARVFLVVAITSAVPYTLTLVQWWKRSGVYTPATIALMTAAFAIGGAALFHFTQVFPSRRPWITAHGWWLCAAYLVPPLPVAVAAWAVGALAMAIQTDTGSGGLGSVSAGLFETFVLLGAIPAIFVVGIVLPFAGVMSLFKSWQEAKRAHDEPARATTFWMLISQLGGGVLAVLVLPLLHFAGVPPMLSRTFGGLAYGFALIMPVAYFLSTPQLRNSQLHT
jgi:hypothetical protein